MVATGGNKLTVIIITINISSTQHTHHRNNSTIILKPTCVYVCVIKRGSDTVANFPRRRAPLSFCTWRANANTCKYWSFMACRFDVGVTIL